MGDGDGWSYCAAGHRHWGRFGAAGLLIRDGDQVMLQHRADWTHEGGTWALPGGALDSHEDALAGALREAGEEASIDAGSVAPIGWLIDDHGGWAYTTVAARALTSIRAEAANAESQEIRWWPVAAIDGLPRHSGFEAAWPRLTHLPSTWTVVVDSANVVGSRPDGWWRDRPAANRRMALDLLAWARAGVTDADLPAGIDGADLSRLLPRPILVVEGEAANDPPRVDGIETALAPASGDDEIVRQTQRALANGDQVTVVTADRALRARLPEGAAAAGPSWLLHQVRAP